jgi:di/tripeptidase
VGREPQSASASTDANVPLARGIPAIAIGAGGTGRAMHTADEWYDDTGSEFGLERAIRLVAALATTDVLVR